MELPSLDRQPVSPEACADHSSATGLVSGKGECCSSSSGAAIGAGKFIPTRVLVLAACAALNSCNLGFDIGVSALIPDAATPSILAHHSILFIGIFNGIVAPSHKSDSIGCWLCCR